MNFNLSTMFTDENMEEVEIVVFYKVKLIQILDWEILEANVSKRAVCKAWLGGDNVQKFVTNTSAPTGNSPASGAANDNVEADGEEPTVAETTVGNEPMEPPVDTTGSYWNLGLDENYYDEQLAAFDNLLCETYNIEREELVVNGILYGRDEYGTAYGMDYCLTAEDVYDYQIFIDSMESIAAQEEAYQETNGEQGYEPGTTTAYVYVIYVPENISEEEYQAIMEAATEMQEYYSDYAQEQYGINIPVTVDLVKAGGNYDYSNEGTGGN